MNKFSELEAWQKVILIGIVLAGILAGGLWLGSIIFLTKIGQSRSFASITFLYKYWTIYGHYAGVTNQILFSAGAGALIMLLPVGIAVIPQKRKLHGDAKLAKEKDFAENGMLESGKGDRFILGKFGGKHIFAGEKPCSVMLAAAPRTGKGAAELQPNMFHLNCSVFVTDIRQESYRITSGWRKQFSEVYLFNPFPGKAKDPKGQIIKDADGNEIWELRTDQYNPFFYVPDDPALRINEIQKIANFLFPDPPGDKDPFWAASSRSLFLGLSLYAFETEGKPHTIGEVLRLAQSCGDDGDSISAYWNGIIAARANSPAPLSGNCIQALKDFLTTGGNTVTNIRKSLTSALELWQNPFVDAATSNNSFDFRDLRKKKMSIYVGISPDNLGRAAPILNLLIQQLMDQNMHEMPEENPALKYRIAMMLDEIVAAGRLATLPKTIGYLNGYGILQFFMIQSFSQLRSVYGKEDAQTIIDCCQIKLAFAPKSQEDAELLSKEFGYATEDAKSSSRNRGIFNQNTGSESTSHARRALLLPQEFRQLGKNKMVILSEGLPPAIINKLWYFKNAFYKKCVLPPVKAPLLDFKEIIPATESQAPEVAIAKPGAYPLPEIPINPDFGANTADFDDLFSSPGPDPATEEKLLKVPDSVQYYAPETINLDEIIQTILEEDCHFTPETLSVVESNKASLSDLEQDFSDIEFSASELAGEKNEWSDTDIDNLVKGFFEALPTPKEAEAA